MRPVLSLLLGVVLGCAGGAPTASEADLLAARDRIWKAWFANDRPTLEAMLPADFVGIDPGTSAWTTRDSALAGAARFAAGGGSLVSLEFTDTRTQTYGDVAFVYSHYAVVTRQGSDTSRLSGRATEVFRRVGGRWTNPGWHLDQGQ
jgi:ketosteroid isomerase-like protein